MYSFIKRSIFWTVLLYVCAEQSAEACTPGTWGTECLNACGKCKNGVACRISDGYCPDGCSAGYKKTVYCTNECPDGSYGDECNARCNINCEGTCNKTNGRCRSCKAGWKGDTCSTECATGEWGSNCKEQCGNCIDGSTCNKFNGRCEKGCKTGYTSYTCDVCDDGYYGSSCEHKCDETCKDTCHKVTGDCEKCPGGMTNGECITGAKTLNIQHSTVQTDAEIYVEEEDDTLTTTARSLDVTSEEQQTSSDTAQTGNAAQASASTAYTPKRFQYLNVLVIFLLTL